MSKVVVISLPKTPRIMLLVAVFFGFILAIVGFQSRFTPNSIELGVTSKTPSVAQDRIEAELITIRPNGFNPLEITRPKGRFILAFTNHSGVHDLDLKLDREAGNRIHEVRMPRGRLAGKKTVDLPPGSYILTEANHPDWVCRITVTAK